MFNMGGESKDLRNYSQLFTSVCDPRARYKLLICGQFSEMESSPCGFRVTSEDLASEVNWLLDAQLVQRNWFLLVEIPLIWCLGQTQILSFLPFVSGPQTLGTILCWAEYSKSLTTGGVAVLRWQRNGTGNQFLLHKFIKRLFYCWATSTKQLLNACRGHQAPRKAAHSLRKEAGQNIRDKKRDRNIRYEDPCQGGSRGGEVSKHQETFSPEGLWRSFVISEGNITRRRNTHQHTHTHTQYAANGKS